ncbi:MAG: hypothetical protein MH321_14170 [Leptospiraceae bacterium]|nr:hypothetical protein [Leptospiraceae bacterium]
MKGSSRTILKAIDKKVVKETIEDGAKGGAILPGLIFDGKLGKLTQHAKDWAVSTKGGPQEVASRVQKLATHFYNNSQLIKQGNWRGGINDAIFYSNGKHIVVTKSDGTFITILKNAQKNKWFQNANEIWSK